MCKHASIPLIRQGSWKSSGTYSLRYSSFFVPWSKVTHKGVGRIHDSTVWTHQCSWPEDPTNICKERSSGRCVCVRYACALLSCKAHLTQDEHPDFITFASKLAEVLRHSIFVDQVTYSLRPTEEYRRLIYSRRSSTHMRRNKKYLRCWKNTLLRTSWRSVTNSADQASRH